MSRLNSVAAFNFSKASGDFDYIASLPAGNVEALKHEVKSEFDVVGRHETRETNVLLLKIQSVNASGLKPSSSRNLHEGNSSHSGAGQWSCKNSRISNLADFLETYLRIPVIDRTGLTNSFDIDLKWKQSDWKNTNPDGLKQSLLDQLGLELVPSNEPIEMLVVEKVK